MYVSAAQTILNHRAFFILPLFAIKKDDLEKENVAVYLM